MLRRRQSSPDTPAAAAVEPDPGGAEAWIDLYRRRAGANRPPGPLPAGTALAAARHAALRSGDYAVTEPAPGL